MYSLKETKDGHWEWECFQSSYGLTSGEENTLAQAKIELAIAEAELFERPYPPAVVKAMRASPELFAADFPDK